MSRNLTGCPENVSTPLTAGIVSAGSGAGGLVLIGTSGAHDFATCDVVSIAGVVGTTEANTVSPITVVSSTTFLLDDVPFVNAYVSGGTATDTSLTPSTTVPDDGEAGTAQSIEASIELALDRTQYLQQQILGIGVDMPVEEFGASGSTTVPLGARFALIELCGGGGGGGGGRNADTTNDHWTFGGGGGGGAKRTITLVAVTVGQAVGVVVGQGGDGGANGTTPATGSNGETSYVTLDGVTVANSYGGQGGTGCSGFPTGTPAWTPGGGPIWADVVRLGTASHHLNTVVLQPVTAGQGGFGSAGVAGTSGIASDDGRGGGAGGAVGADGSNKRGGGGGGGGGGSWGGDWNTATGGAGGVGGAGSAAGDGGSGTAGFAGNDRGAGGGGGGGGGSGALSGGGGGIGGPGADGFVRIGWVR